MADRRGAPTFAACPKNARGDGHDYTGRIYDCVVGLGTPRVRNMILAPLLPAAGDPQTPSNP